MRGALAIEGGVLAKEAHGNFDALLQRLVEEWADVHRRISEVIEMDLAGDGGSDALDDDDASDEGAWVGLPPKLVRANEEKLRNRVRREQVSGQLDAVDSARAAYELAISRDLVPIAKAALRGTGASSSSDVALRSCFAYDIHNNAFWLKTKALKVGNVCAEAKALGHDVSALEHPRDRNGKSVGDRWSTQAVEAAAIVYRIAVTEASQAIRDRLRSLSTDIARTSSTDVAAACVLCP